MLSAEGITRSTQLLEDFNLDAYRHATLRTGGVKRDENATQSPNRQMARSNKSLDCLFAEFLLFSCWQWKF
jgi:hypothetical protein